MQLTIKNKIKSRDQFYENRATLYSSLYCSGKNSHYEGFLDDEVTMVWDKYYAVSYTLLPAHFHRLIEQCSTFYFTRDVFQIIICVLMHFWQINPLIVLLFDIYDVFYEMFDIKEGS
jgi:hypothetical protein